METLIIIGGTAITIALGIIGWGINRYVTLQDNRNSQIETIIRNMSESFGDAVDDLKMLITKLAIKSESHKTLCGERHSTIERDIEAIKKKIGIL